MTDVLDKINNLLDDVTCWCTWSPEWLPLTHEQFGLANEYPAHAVSAEWNLPEPDEGYECWDGTSPDACSTETDDLDQGQAFIVLASAWDFAGVIEETEHDDDQAVLLRTVTRHPAGEPDIIELARGTVAELMAG